MRRIRPEPKGLKSKAPPLFAAPEEAGDFGREIVRLDAPKESEGNGLGMQVADDSLRQGGRANPKTRPTNKHAWRAPNVMADPFDGPLH